MKGDAAPFVDATPGLQLPEHVHLFGIRHHGPGSARGLLRELQSLEPDCVLVEGPADASAMLSFVKDPSMEPPVALLTYVEDRPHLATFFPLAVFSPEWQAIRFALERGIYVAFMDLPQCHQLALSAQKLNETAPEPLTSPPALETDAPAPGDAPEAHRVREDPVGYLAAVAGYDDGERWWDLTFEQRRDTQGVSRAVLEAMHALRSGLDLPTDTPEALREARREAYMRKTVRESCKAGFQRIAVVCGAWHTPALLNLETKKQDAALLKGLPSIKVASSWIPWTYGRLARDSGYGAGIDAPGWYDHLWHFPHEVSIRWLARVATTLRSKGMDASSASVIEAVRLSDALAALRHRPSPDLSDLTDAALAVLCHGQQAPLAMIKRDLQIAERLGSVPRDVPTVPLAADIERQLKHLRLKRYTEEGKAEVDLLLDLREEFDREKSYLLHRLNLLGIAWGHLDKKREKGSNKEFWKLHWQPDFAVSIIEAGVWGNTLKDAATAFTLSQASSADSIVQLTPLLERALMADLHRCVPSIVSRIQAVSAATSNVAHLIEALPPLVDIVHYGDARQTDATGVHAVLDGLLARICIGLPSACASLDDDAALSMMALLSKLHSALSLLESEEHGLALDKVLQVLAHDDTLHGRVSGRATRLLLDSGGLSPEATGVRMGLMLSPGQAPPASAAWLEGFLWGSGLLLIHDERLFSLLDQWLTSLNLERFIEVLPLLRRIFSVLPAPERRQLGEKVARRASVAPAQGQSVEEMGGEMRAAIRVVTEWLRQTGSIRAPLELKEDGHDI